MSENPVQANALYKIVKSLSNLGLLQDDPLSVCIEREGRKPVYPCSRGYPKLDLSQLEWAREKGGFWFLGQIKTIWIELDEKQKQTWNSEAFIRRFMEMAETAGFCLKFERYRDTRVCNGGDLNVFY